MLKKQLTYEDLDGNEVTETFEFHISKAELTKMEIAEVSMTDRLKAIAAENETHKVLEIFEEFIKMSYGVRSEDGKRFIKTEQQTEEFMQTEAYSALVMEIVSDPMAMVNFLMGVVPQGLSKNIDMNKAMSDPEVTKDFPMQASELRKLLEEQESGAKTAPSDAVEDVPQTPTGPDDGFGPPIERPRTLDHLPKRSEMRHDGGADYS